MEEWRKSRYHNLNENIVETIEKYVYNETAKAFAVLRRLLNVDGIVSLYAAHVCDNCYSSVYPSMNT
jgi:hypothetical protein